MPLQWLDPSQPDQVFPELDQALIDPNGLIAFDGCLSAQRLINAYRAGIFPWYSQNEPILWWSPDPRLVLKPEEIIISHSLAKTIRKQVFDVRIDTAFEQVIKACAEQRPGSEGTWISTEIIDAYTELHDLGVAHSIEAWHENQLVGGLYGIGLGRIFFGESMFQRRTDASKVAFAYLAKKLENWQYPLIDCQVKSQHLISLGAKEIPRRQFRQLLDQYCNYPDAWQI